MNRFRIHPSALTIAGHPCPTSGEIAGRNIPADNRYYLTSFGGGSDTQGMACGGTADGTWFYLADSWRWPCGTKIRISNPANGLAVIAQVADVGPNICVEQAAGLPIIDASPLVSRALFGSDSSGWADHRLVIAEPSDQFASLGPDMTASGSAFTDFLLVAAGAYLLWRAFR